MNAINLIAQSRVGTKTIAGTEWPVTNQVERHAHGGRRPEWVLVVGLCNGTAARSERYATKKAAMQALLAAE